MAVVISDASPLVHLSAIGRFGLLKEIYLQLLIPPAVWKEVVVDGKGRAGQSEVTAGIEAGWILIQAPTSDFNQRPELSGLDPGEAEALALALEIKADLVLLDEVRGRAAARKLFLRAVGTLGVLIEAKRKGLVSRVAEELQKLRTHSQLHLTTELEQQVLSLAGESV
jgi:predicted nucleic acid-binding protein